MNEKTPPRRPATFKLDDPGVVVMDPDDGGRLTRGTIQIVPEAEPAQLPVPLDTPLVPARRGFRWGTLFWSAVAGLVVLGTGLGVINLVEDLFARNEGLGVLGLGLAVIAAVALAVVTTRELVGLARLATIEKLHLRAAEVLISDDRAASRVIVADLLKLAHQTPQLARARSTLQSHTDDIIDGADMGSGEIRPQRDRLTVIRDRIAPGVLVGAKIAARQEAERVLRLELDRAIEIGAGLIRAALALLDIAARDQRRHELSIQLHRRIGIAEGLIDLAARDVKSRAAGEGLGAILRGACGIVDDARARRLGLVRRRPAAILDIARAGRAGEHRPKQQRKRQQLWETNAAGGGINADRA